MTPTDEVIRTVMAKSPHGEWVTAKEVARALHPSPTSPRQ
jgi:hypothetical protein